MEDDEGSPLGIGSDMDQYHKGNTGVMILDVTVALADIHYPTDLNLVNACREHTEKIIDRLCPFCGLKKKICFFQWH